MISPVAQEFQKEQTSQSREAVEAVTRQWRRMGADFDSSWAMIAGNITAIMTMTQRDSAQRSRDYFVNVLEDTGQTIYMGNGEPNINAFVGVNGNGLAIDSAMYGAVIHAKSNIARGGTVHSALTSGQKWIQGATEFALADTVRAVNRVQFPTMKVEHYVRILTTPSCSRCAILAGKTYKSSTPFLRHPRCDCQHLPVNEEVAGDMLFNSEDYFDSLPADQQDKIFTKGGAEAIRNGADINQVVNARRGMYTTADGKFATDEGTTKRGHYGYTQRKFTKKPLKTRERAVRDRLLPEQIQKMAGNDRKRYLNLLRYYGYLI